MGFLDQSTNNIILDAVLTDKGRELLANGAGSFSISKFAFADDEVNYNYINKYGRTVGKEKIEKNTPVLEASTTGNLGLRYRLRSFNNDSLTTLPVLSITAGLNDDGVIPLARNNDSTVGSLTYANITIEQILSGATQCDPDCTNYAYKLMINNLFFRVAGQVPDSVDDSDIATYTIPSAADISPQNLSKCRFKITAKSIAPAVFSSYKQKGGTTVVTPMTVSGFNDGSFVTVNLQLS